MIQGIGIDIIEIERIDLIIKRRGQRFLDRIFTAQEQEYCLRHSQKVKHFAGRFVAKEAIVKALGIGLRQGISWLDMEIINDNRGRPIVTFSEFLNQKFHHPVLNISISHSLHYANAVAIWESFHNEKGMM